VKGLFLLLGFISFSASALETDNYLAWKKELRDSGPAINSYFNHEITHVLKTSDPDLSCEEVTQKIGEVFESHLVHDNPVENHLLSVLSSEEIFPTSLYYVEESIYRDPFRVYIPYFGLAPNVQVNGFYFGTDKLSHFASTGRIYYEKFQKSSSLKSAISWGVRDEKTLHGYWASGVFSYADLEANYQGFLFYQDLCQGSHPYLTKKGSRWSLQRPFKIEKYVSGLWDETYLESYRLPGNWNKVKGFIQREYCPLKDSPLVRKRFHYYQTHYPLRSTLGLLEGLDLPKAQSFQELCQSFEVQSL